MTMSEFKAWFEGFTENIQKQPTQKQWKRIVERVGEIERDAVVEHHYHRDWWPIWYTPITSGPQCGMIGGGISVEWSYTDANAYNIGALEAQNLDSGTVTISQ